MAAADFDSSKLDLLNNLANGMDYSPKGSIDLPIVDLVNFINKNENYVTTSSCSGMYFSQKPLIFTMILINDTDKN